MKKNFLVILLSFSAIQIYAQSQMVKYFNMIPSEKRHNMTITEKKGKFSTTNDTPTKVLVDDKNGFLEVTDDGTGGGTLTYQLAMFKDVAGKVTLAYSLHGFDDVIHTSELHFFDPINKMATISQKIFNVGVSESDYKQSAYKGKAKLTDFVSAENNTEYTYYILPRQGVEIKAYHGYVALDNACLNEKKTAACEFRAQFRPFILLKWDKTKSVFTKVIPVSKK
jgi:hypothetical protein